MALVTGPLHSSEARGVVGGKTGLVYNTHRGRAYVKANAVPALEYTDPQIATRALMNTIIAAWQALSADRRTAWHHFAEENHLCDWTGQLKRLTGWNWFAKANSPLLYCTLSLLTDPPYPITGYLPANLVVTNYEAESELTWTPLDPPPDPAWFFILWQTAPHAPTVHPSIKHAKRVSHTYESVGSHIWPTEDPGWTTVYIQPISAQGISMPPTRLLLEVT
jgi:hypothetical protein